MTNRNNKHTPGPWRTAYSKTHEFGGGNIRSDHHVDGTGALLFATGPMFHDYVVDREEEIANLNLVGAAPELLAALERLMKWYTMLGDEVMELHFADDGFGHEDTLELERQYKETGSAWLQARDAIAKAQGD